MEGIILAIAVITVIGIVCAIVLSVASKVMYVYEDERVGIARECLPGANCGACGFPGCDGYAKALVEDPELPVTLCPPGGADCVTALADALGREAGEIVKQVAMLHCCGDSNSTSGKMEYQGLTTCAGAKLVYGGPGKCAFSCMGLGDCVEVCPENAMWIDGGLVRIDPDMCTGCGICTKVCPNNLLEVHKASDNVVVTCSNKEKGAATRKVCTKGCIACKLCEKKCERDAIHVIDNLAVIDYEKCNACGECIAACKLGCIEIVAV